MKVRVVAALLMLLAGGCASSDSGDDESALFEQERSRVLGLVELEGSPLERAILEDGLVTASEHEEAALALVACADKRGVLVSLDEDPDGGFTFTAESSDESFAVVEECMATTFSNVDIVFAIQNSASAEVRERLREMMVTCLQERGIEVESWPDVGREIDALIESECSDSAVSQGAGGDE